MKTKFIHLYSIGMFVLGVFFDLVQKRIHELSLMQMDFFLENKVGLLLNLVFFIPLAYLAFAILRSSQSVGSRLLYIIAGTLLLLLAVPPLWNLPIPIAWLSILQLPALPRSYVGIACSLIVTSNLLGLLIHRKNREGEALTRNNPL